MLFVFYSATLVILTSPHNISLYEYVCVEVVATLSFTVNTLVYTLSITPSNFSILRRPRLMYNLTCSPFKDNTARLISSNVVMFRFIFHRPIKSLGENKHFIQMRQNNIKFGKY